jgi:hypothetical protein
MRVIVESGEQGFLDIVVGGGSFFFFFFSSPFSFVLLLFVGSFGKGEGGGWFPYFACEQQHTPSLSLESRVKQSFKERKAATVKDG